MGCRELQYYFRDGVNSDHHRASGSIPNRFVFRFSSEYHDSETNLVYYNYRYYSPELGRWLSRDPIGENGGWNLYGFVRNDGINNLDYLGLFISASGIQSGRYIFTCNCGWLDRGHFGDYSKRATRLLKAMRKKKKGSLTFSMSVPLGQDVKKKFAWDFTSKKKIDYYKEMYEKIKLMSFTEEVIQDIGAGGGLLGGWTAFAYEDITSNMFGAMIAKIMDRDSLNYDKALKKALAGCVQVSKDDALTVFNANKKILTSGTLRRASQTKMKCNPCKKKKNKQGKSAWTYGGKPYTSYKEWQELLKIAK